MKVGGEAEAAAPCSVVGGACPPQPHDKAAGRGGRHEAACLEDASATGAAARFQHLLEGLEAPGDSGNPPVAPPWLDRALFEKGRQFYRRFLFCVFVSDLVALLMMFSVDRILRPLMHTRRSSTPLGALRRYVSTIAHVMTWYSGDLWDPADAAHQDILRVRRIHQAAAAAFNSPQHRAAVDLASAAAAPPGGAAPACPFHSSLRQDLRGEAEPGAALETRRGLYISQWDQAFTQYAFLGVMVAHPWRMGAWWATEEELAGFVHFWRGAGWLLGIEDRYNFCSGGLEETRALCREMERRVVRPCLAAAGRDHEVMGTALVEGLGAVMPGFSYPAVLRLVGDALGLPMPAVTAAMSLRHRLHYAWLRLLMHGLFLVPGVVRLFNALLQAGLRAVQGRNPRWRPHVTVTPYAY